MIQLFDLQPFLSLLRLIFITSFSIWVLFSLVSRVIRELQLRKRFNKLPKLPTTGIAGLLLGNVDAYYYAMRHLPITQGLHFLIQL